MTSTCFLSGVGFCPVRRSAAIALPLLCLMVLGSPQNVPAQGFTSQDVTLRSWLNLSDFGDNVQNGNDCWGYTSPSGREYAIFGHYKGTAVVEITDPDNAVILNNLAWQYQQEKTWDRAHELASRAYELQPESGSIADTLGWILRDIGQLDKSLKILTDASRLEPDNGEIQYHYAVVLSESGKTDKARHILETLSKEDTQFPSREQANSLLAEL